MEITTSFKEKQKEDLTKLANKTLRVVTIYVSMQTNKKTSTVVPAKSDSGVILCLQLLSKILTCKLHLS